MAVSPIQQLIALGQANPLTTGTPDFSGLVNASASTSPSVGQTSINLNAIPASYLGSSSGGSSSGSSSAAPPDLSSYDQSINATQSQLNNLSPGLNNALAGNVDQYNTTINGLTQQRALTDQTYNQNKLDNSQNYVTAKNTINTNTGNTINGLDRLLAARGAAGESAGNYAALLAAGQGSQQRSAAGTTFGKNQQALDTNYNNYVNAYNTNVDNAALQKQEADNQAKATYDTNRANLLQSLASIVNERTAASGGHGVSASQPYINEANSLLADANTVGRPIAVAAQTPLTYTAPTLASYTTNPTAVTTSAAPNATTDSAIPYLALLNNRQNQQGQ